MKRREFLRAGAAAIAGSGVRAQGSEENTIPQAQVATRAQKAASLEAAITKLKAKWDPILESYKNNPEGLKEYLNTMVRPALSSTLRRPAGTGNLGTDAQINPQFMEAYTVLSNAGLGLAADPIYFSPTEIGYARSQNTSVANPVDEGLAQLQKAAAMGLNAFVSYVSGKPSAGIKFVQGPVSAPMDTFESNAGTANLSADNSNITALNLSGNVTNSSFNNSTISYVTLAANKSQIRNLSLKNSSIGTLDMFDSVSNMDLRSSTVKNIYFDSIALSNSANSAPILLTPSNELTFLNAFKTTTNGISGAGSVIMYNGDFTQCNIPSIRNDYGNFTFLNCAFVASNIPESQITQPNVNIATSIAIGTGWSSSTLQQLEEAGCVTNVAQLSSLLTSFNPLVTDPAIGNIRPNQFCARIAAEQIANNAEVQAIVKPSASDLAGLRSAIQSFDAKFSDFKAVVQERTKDPTRDIGRAA